MRGWAVNLFLFDSWWVRTASLLPARHRGRCQTPGRWRCRSRGTCRRPPPPPSACSPPCRATSLSTWKSMFWWLMARLQSWQFNLWLYDIFYITKNATFCIFCYVNFDLGKVILIGLDQRYIIVKWWRPGSNFLNYTEEPQTPNAQLCSEWWDNQPDDIRLIFFHNRHFNLNPSSRRHLMLLTIFRSSLQIFPRAFLAALNKRCLPNTIIPYKSHSGLSQSVSLVWV